MVENENIDATAGEDVFYEAEEALVPKIVTDVVTPTEQEIQQHAPHPLHTNYGEPYVSTNSWIFIDFYCVLLNFRVLFLWNEPPL